MVRSEITLKREDEPQGRGRLNIQHFLQKGGETPPRHKPILKNYPTLIFQAVPSFLSSSTIFISASSFLILSDVVQSFFFLASSR